MQDSQHKSTSPDRPSAVVALYDRSAWEVLLFDFFNRSGARDARPSAGVSPKKRGSSVGILVVGGILGGLALIFLNSYVSRQDAPPPLSQAAIDLANSPEGQKFQKEYAAGAAANIKIMEKHAASLSH